MPNDVDKSLLDRLRALRGGPSPSKASPVSGSSIEIKVDPIERVKTPTREDTLAARLKSLRAASDSPTSSSSSPKVVYEAASRPQPVLTESEKSPSWNEKAGGNAQNEEDDVDAMFQTDDQTLEELLGDVKEEPTDEEVKALLEELSLSIPKDAEPSEEKRNDGHGDSDDSDGEQMQKEVDNVIAKFQDEAEIEAGLEKSQNDSDQEEELPESNEDGQDSDDANLDLALPSVPSNLDDIPSSSPSNTQRAGSADIDDITARMAALRAPASGSQDASLDLPSVPSAKPSGQPVNRLTSRTNYTDEDADGWCNVCLEDATLRCQGCDDDVYCTRCWGEMHVGPAAAFDDRSHKAVQFTRARKKEKRRVALGS